MSDVSNRIVQKLWSYCNVLRDDGLSYQDYLEQLTFLLFLKMADEAASHGRADALPEGCRWRDLARVDLDGTALAAKYAEILHRLGDSGGMLGIIFKKSQNRIQDPAKLKNLIVDLIAKEEWGSLTADVKGEAYEGLLEKNAQDVKSGAGQYFTPRVLIDAIVDCVAPRPGETICDPACGTGGFLLSAYRYLTKHHRLDKDELNDLRYRTLRGVELVDGVSRLCAMNLYLRGIGPNDAETEPPIRTADALQKAPDRQFDVVITNPPFGKKSSITVVTDEGDLDRQAVVYTRSDFFAETSNKQLNFVQHVCSLLEVNGGRAAVVLPDNVLFEGGAGTIIRDTLLKTCDLHTMLRLPTGIFYAQGVKANVLFFDRKPGAPHPWTRKLWVYDLRTNIHCTLKQNPLSRADLDEFVSLYRPGEAREARRPTWGPDSPNGRWRAYDYDELILRDKKSLDLFWLRDDAADAARNLPAPNILAERIADNLVNALGTIRDILADLDARAK